MENKDENSVAPPNGERVTNSQLYRALYDLDQGLSKRFTTMLDAINLGREDLDDHKKNDQHGSDKKITAAAGGGMIGLLAIVAAIAAKLFGVGI